MEWVSNVEDRRDQRIPNKLDEIIDKLNGVNISIARIEVDVAHHIKRTDLLEQQVEPMKKHADELAGVVKFLKLAGVIIALIEAVRMFH